MKTFKTLRVQSNITFNAEKFGSSFTSIFSAASLRSFPNPVVIFRGGVLEDVLGLEDVLEDRF